MKNLKEIVLFDQFRNVGLNVSCLHVKVLFCLFTQKSILQLLNSSGIKKILAFVFDHSAFDFDLKEIKHYSMQSLSFKFIETV